MSCNGCRVLRKGCSDGCVLRSSLQWITTPEAQGHATLFLAKFFGRSDLLSFISAVPESQRPALFQSLLFEACGRTVNPVNGAVGLLWSGNWHVCQAAVETVLAGGTLRPLSSGIISTSTSPNGSSRRSLVDVAPTGRSFLMPHRSNHHQHYNHNNQSRAKSKTVVADRYGDTTSFYTEEDSGTTTLESNGGGLKLLNLFV